MPQFALCNVLGLCYALIGCIALYCFVMLSYCLTVKQVQKGLATNQAHPLSRVLTVHRISFV